MSIGEYDSEPKKENIWLIYKDKLILGIGILLIAVVTFQGGYLFGKQSKNDSVTVSQKACAPCPDPKRATTDSESAEDGSSSAAAAIETKKADVSANENQKCAFVASKNSNKYHLPTCQYAAKIKSENKICFSAKDEAAGRGFQAAKCCIK